MNKIIDASKMDITDSRLKIRLYSLKQILILNSSSYKTWNELATLTNEYIKNNIRECGLPSTTNIYFETTAELYRQSIFPLIQADDGWVIRYGVPISRNGVGVKISKDLNEIDEYLGVEKTRALSIMKKLAPIRAHRSRLQTYYWVQKEL